MTDSLTPEAAQEIAQWADSTFGLPSRFTRKFLDTNSTKEEGTDFTAKEYGRCLRAEARNRRKPGSISMHHQFCDKFRSVGLSSEASESLWNSGFRKVSTSCLAGQIARRYAKTIGFDDAGISNVSDIFEDKFSQTKLTECSGLQKDDLRKEIQAIDCLNGSLLYDKCNDPDEREEAEWSVQQRLKDEDYYSDELMKRTMSRLNNSFSAFAATAKSFRPETWDVESSVQCPEFVTLPPGTGLTSSLSNQTAQASSKSKSWDEDQISIVERAGTKVGPTASPASVATQIVDRTSQPVELPNFPSLPATATTQTNGLPPSGSFASINQNVANGSSLVLSSNTDSRASSVGGKADRVFSAAGSNTTAGSSVTGGSTNVSVTTEIPHTESGKNSENTSSSGPLSSSSSSFSDLPPGLTPTPAGHSKSNNDTSSRDDIIAGAAAASQKKSSELSEDRKSRWRESVQAELDRRLKRPQGLLKAIDGETLTDAEFSLFETQNVNPRQYRREIMKMFPNTWYSKNSDVRDYNRDLSDGMKQLDSGTFSADRRIWDREHGKDLHDGSFTGSVSRNPEDHNSKNTDRVLDWLEPNNQTQSDLSEVETAMQKQEDEISSLETRSADPPSGGVEAIWAREKTDAERTPSKCGIETNRPEALRDAFLGEEMNGNWENRTIGNWSYDNNAPISGTGYPRRRQPEPTGDRTFTDGLEGIR